MSKLIIHMDPVMPTEIFQIKEGLEEKIAQVSPPPVNILKFLANYMTNINESTEVTFIGPDDYIDPWITEANQFEFVNAHKK